MRDLPRIFAVYNQIDGALEQQRARGLAEAEFSQVVNDQAYFLICWGQLEVAIDERCRDAVRRRRADPDWQVRRAWDLYNPEESRFSGLTFEGRVMLVLDGRGGRGSPFALTVKHYGIRNQIAHGRLIATRVNVSAFVGDCYTIQSALHRAS